MFASQVNMQFENVLIEQFDLRMRVEQIRSRVLKPQVWIYINARVPRRRQFLHELL